MAITVEPAFLETVDTPHDFEFQTARRFQHEFLQWVNGGRSPVCVLQSPTGSGKTAAFKQFVKERNKVLLVYPTNALLEQQQEIINDDPDLSSVVISGDTLTRTGLDRVKELESYVTGPAGHDVIISNPDILSAITQDQYTDFNDRLLRLFDIFDGIVYDEFHFYDAFEESGILLQMKVIRERGNADIVLSSATPSEDYLSFIEENLGLQVTRIQPTYADEENEIGKFRCKTELELHQERLSDSFEWIAQKLTSFCQSRDSDSKAAVIFNSAKQSNQFSSYLAQHAPAVYQAERKDNGYDTNREKEDNNQFSVLNTTSKGEVGLDYDVTLLFVANPYDAQSFIQRIGRAGRKNPAEVHCFNFGSVQWGDNIPYSRLEKEIYNTLPTPSQTEDRLQTLTSLRAAYALWSRTQNDAGTNPEITEDFGDVTDVEKWLSFFGSVSEEQQADRGLLDPTPSQTATELLNLAHQTIPTLGTLRGQSFQQDVEYPVAGEQIETEYGLLSALRQYRLKGIDNGTLLLSSGEPTIEVKYPALSSTYNYSDSVYKTIREVRADLSDALSEHTNEIQDKTAVNPTLLREFLMAISPKYLTPSKATTRQFELSLNAAQSTVTISQR